MAREGPWRIPRRTVVFDSQQQEVRLPAPASEGACDLSDPSYLLLDIGTVER